MDSSKCSSRITVTSGKGEHQAQPNKLGPTLTPTLSHKGEGVEERIIRDRFEV